MASIACDCLTGNVVSHTMPQSGPVDDCLFKCLSDNERMCSMQAGTTWVRVINLLTNPEMCPYETGWAVYGHWIPRQTNETQNSIQMELLKQLPMGLTLGMLLLLALNLALSPSYHYQVHDASYPELRNSSLLYWFLWFSWLATLVNFYLTSSLKSKCKKPPVGGAGSSQSLV